MEKNEPKKNRAFSIKQKMLLFILIPVTIIFITAFTFILIDFQLSVKNNTENLIKSQAYSYSLKIQNELNHFIELNRFIKQSFESFDNIPMENRREELSALMKDILYKNSKVLSIWSIWELNSIDTLRNIYKNKPGSTILGNFRHLYYRSNGQIQLSDYVEQNPSNVFNGKLYNKAKSQKKEIVVSHFYLDYNQSSSHKLQTNIVMPLYKNRDFLGVVGVDMELKKIQKIIQNIDNINQSEAYLFSNNGMCISSPITEDLGKQVNEIFIDESTDFNLLNNISKGLMLDFYFKNLGEKYYYTLQPVTIGKTNTPWALLLKLPYSYIQNQTNQSVKLAIIGGAIGTILILILLIYISKNISTPLTRLCQKMDTIANGEIGDEYIPARDASVEIQDIAQSYNKLSCSLQNSTQFAEDIKNGNLESEYNLLGANDQLGHALLGMRHQLKQSIKKQEQRQEEDRKRFWASDGIASLNEILRKQEDINELSLKILGFIIQYLNANQGGIFIRNNTEQNMTILELKAFYAFDRRKYIQKTFELGEGLVGNCALEKETIHLTEIPQNYIQITSGLGGSNPRSLLLVPMKVDDEVLGIIEIASFNSYEDYQIQFLEQASLIIASSLNMSETNKRTSDLLEQTQQQAEEMAAQEEEMRQNMEELQATQEESARKIKEFEKLLAQNSISNS